MPEALFGLSRFQYAGQLADALKKAGFDVAFTANNHIMDMGIDGMKRTLRIAKRPGLLLRGHSLKGKRDYIVLNAKGIKSASSHISMRRRNTRRPTINSVPIPKMPGFY